MVSSAGPVNSARPSASSQPAHPAQQTPSSRTFAIIYPMAHPFYETVTRIAEEAAEPYGVSLIVKAPDEINLEQQIRMMDMAIKQKVDGIALDPIDAGALAPVINKAVQAGIPVVTFEADAPASSRLAYIGTDNFAGGQRLGEVVSRLLKGKGMILVENGRSQLGIHRERLDGMLRYINEKTSIQVLEVRHHEGSGDRALSDLEQMINEHPHFDAFVALDFVSSTSSILVWKAKGLSRDAVAFGLTPSSLEAIRNGQITAVIARNEQEWGRQIIELLIQADEGKTVPSFIDTGIQEITISAASELEMILKPEKSHRRP
ncbi:sugar ABC transporter substrate-binding protein [Paenibacillus sp. y28]|uniref:sugar ABC transporter substrate-binding protein n=1 Tax=Paenibacillus sp. y28 TaxID=3129110 RepID=UPI003017D859